tara:strand:+ start:1232 stop:2377 length:1146 start_codon:yes stop_codon:yes gene_type:complete
MVSPVALPVQAANSLLPSLLARELRGHGVDTAFVSHPTAGSAVAGVTPITHIPRRGSGLFHRSRAGAILAGVRIGLGLSRALRGADLIHLHSNGLMIEVASRVARWRATPRIITLYGTDIWHHEPASHRRFADTVTGASHRVFYSRALLTHARSLGLATDPSTVIHAPVVEAFRVVPEEERRQIRCELGVGAGPLLLTVKRLHEVAGYPDLLSAMPAILADSPRATLWIIGQGALRADFERRVAELQLARSVRFLGRIDNARLWRYYAAADLFVLPSRLESWGSVSIEALACGTPVVASATAGSTEVQSFFPDDMTLFTVEDPSALAVAVRSVLARDTPRAGPEAARIIDARFRPAVCAAEYLDVYERTLREASARRLSRS